MSSWLNSTATESHEITNKIFDEAIYYRTRDLSYNDKKQYYTAPNQLANIIFTLSANLEGIAENANEEIQWSYSFEEASLINKIKEKNNLIDFEDMFLSDINFNLNIKFNPKVSSLYYAADRKYNMPKIEEYLKLLATQKILMEYKKDIIKKSCSGGTPLKSRSEYYINGNIPWLRTQDVRFNEIYEANSFITEKAVQETSAKWIPENCVIVAISGASAGRCAINKFSTTTNQHCLNMEIDITKALYKYVFY